MAILIVDDESGTRNALRELLVSMGHKVILDAKNGDEALRFIQSEKNRLLMILSDWEMPYMDGIQLLDRVSQQSDLDLIPFVLITSDLSQGKLQELKTKCPRLDESLLKPFQRAALGKVLTAAYQHRQGARSKLIYLGNKLDEVKEIQQGLQGQAPRLGQEWIVVENVSKLKEKAEAESRHLGGIIIQPEFYQDAGSWLAILKKSSLGIATMIGCASENPQVLAAMDDLRFNSQFFANSLRPLIEAMNSRRVAGWEANMGLQAARTLVQSKQLPKALAQLEKIIRLDPTNLDSHVMIGDVYEQQGDTQKSLSHRQTALKINPFSAKAHIKLLGFLAAQGADSQTIQQAANVAVVNCPQSLEVLFAAANATQSRELAEKVLTLEPSHKEAAELLQKMKQ